MIYLTATPGDAAGVRVVRLQRHRGLPKGSVVDLGALWKRGDVGVMFTPANGQWRAALDLAPVIAYDNACFKRPEKFTLAGYERWMDGLAPYHAKSLFATAPDRVGDAEATLALRRPALEAIRSRGIRAAFIAQDGLTAETTPWDEIDCLFVGGTTAWKLSEVAYALASEAKQRGKWVHLGRVNSLRRIRSAKVAGYDSADGTCLAINPPVYIREIAAWLDQLKRQPALKEIA